MEYPIDELQTLGDFIRWGTSQFNKAQLFFGHGTDNAIDEAMVIVYHAIHLPLETPEILWHTRLTYLEKRAILELLTRRVQERMPAPYLTHKAWFAGLSFYVDQRVLIPRSPIGELIEQSFEPWVTSSQVKRVLDLCTGSGCIAIASAILAFPYAEVDAVDISAAALEVAEKNIESYGLESRVHTVYSDLFSSLAGIHYDLIICNPPYVDLEEIQNMPAEYHYEPQMGLEAGIDGLLLVRQILQQALAHLTPHGVLIVEVGVSQTHLLQKYPTIPFTWLEFQRGGEGVFLLSAEQLKEYAEIF